MTNRPRLFNAEYQREPGTIAGCDLLTNVASLRFPITQAMEHGGDGMNQ